jgi:hypothetical protein
LAFIGRNPMDDDNVYIVTGDSGMGMTHGAIAGCSFRISSWPAKPVGTALRSCPQAASRRWDLCARGAQHGGSVRGLGHRRLTCVRRTRFRSGQARSFAAACRRSPRIGDEGPSARAVGRLRTPRMHRAVEPGGENMGLPMPRLALR